MQKTHSPTSTSFRNTKVRKLEIEGNFFNPIKVIYQKKKYLREKKMNIFLLLARKGKRYPLSPFLFSITILVLTSALRQEKERHTDWKEIKL